MVSFKPFLPIPRNSHLSGRLPPGREGVAGGPHQMTPLPPPPPSPHRIPTDRLPPHPLSTPSPDRIDRWATSFAPGWVRARNTAPGKPSLCPPLGHPGRGSPPAPRGIFVGGGGQPRDPQTSPVCPDRNPHLPIFFRWGIQCGFPDPTRLGIIPSAPTVVWRYLCLTFW